MNIHRSGVSINNRGWMLNCRILLKTLTLWKLKTIFFCVCRGIIDSVSMMYFLLLDWIHDCPLVAGAPLNSMQTLRKNCCLAQQLSYSSPMIILQVVCCFFLIQLVKASPVHWISRYSFVLVSSFTCQQDSRSWPVWPGPNRILPHRNVDPNSGLSPHCLLTPGTGWPVVWRPTSSPTRPSPLCKAPWWLWRPPQKSGPSSQSEDTRDDERDITLETFFGWNIPTAHRIPLSCSLATCTIIHDQSRFRPLV